VTEFSLDAGIEVLTRTPTTLRAMLRGLPSQWIGANEGSDTWSPQDVVGHLIHGEETDWIPPGGHSSGCSTGSPSCVRRGSRPYGGGTSRESSWRCGASTPSWAG